MITERFPNGTTEEIYERLANGGKKSPPINEFSKKFPSKF